MIESIAYVPVFIAAIIAFLVLYGRSLDNRKKRYTYRELSPEQIIKKNTRKNSGQNIYGKRSSGHLDINKFVKRHS